MNVPHVADQSHNDAAHTGRRSVLRNLGLGGLAAAGVLVLGDTRTADAANQVTVVVANLLSNLSIDIPVENKKCAVQVCAAVTAVNALLEGDFLTCNVRA